MQKTGIRLRTKGDPAARVRITEAACASRVVSSVFTAVCIVVCKTYRCSLKSPKHSRELCINYAFLSQVMSLGLQGGLRNAWLGLCATRRAGPHQVFIRMGFPPGPPRVLGKLRDKANRCASTSCPAQGGSNSVLL